MELQRAALDRHHEWRTPVLANVAHDAQGEPVPQARTVVLRHADAARQQLHLFTDRRSPKALQLAGHPNASLVFWSKRLSWQLRVQARVEVLTEGGLVQEAWQRVGQSAAAADYLAANAPGALLQDAPDGPDTAGPPGAVLSRPHHLSVLVLQAQEMDWLELGRAGHRRASFGPLGWSWRVP